MEKLMPILKPSGYKQDQELLFKEKLIDSPVSPVVAYAKDAGQMMMYECAVDKKDFDERFPKMKEECLKNLTAIHVDYTITELDDSKIVFVEDNEYASEKILDAEFMKQIGQELDSSSLMVGIPFKGALIAIDANSPLRMKVPVIIKRQYEEAQQDRISDKIFLVQDGDIIALGGESLPDHDEGNFKIIETKEPNYFVELNSRSIDELTDDVNASFQQIMMMVLQRKLFGGVIVFKLNNNILLNQALIDKCHSYIEQITQNELIQTLTQALTSSGVAIKFFHNDVLVAPQTDSTNVETDKLPDYTTFTDEELDIELKRIINAYETGDKIALLVAMKELTNEYRSRDIPMPDERKKWWQFWK